MSKLQLGSTVLGQGGIKGESGDYNINISTPINVSDITSAGENAVLDFQTSITLTSNFTPPVNQTWLFSTGSLDISTYTLTGNNTQLIFNGKKLGINTFNGVVDGTWEKGSNFYTTNFGVIYDGLVATDNQKALLASLQVINNTGGTLISPKGHAYVSAFVPSRYLRDTPQNGYVIGNGGNNVHFIGEGETIFEVIPNDLQNYVVFMVDETEGSLMQGITLYGDRYEHIYSVKFRVPTAATSSGNLIMTDVNTSVVHTIPVTASTVEQNRLEIKNYFDALPNYTATIEDKIYTTDQGDIVVRPTTLGLYENWYVYLNIDSNGTGISVTLNDATHEFGHGLRIFNNVINTKIRNNKIWYFTGDCLSNSNDNQFQTFLTDANYTLGSKIDKDGNIVVDADWMYSDLVDVTGQNFIDAPWFYYRGGSFGGSAGLQEWEYYAAYYDETDTFIEMSPMLDFYKRVDLKPEYKKIRITSKKGTGEPITTQLAPSKVGFNVVIEDNDLGWSRRQGISNPHANSNILRNYIHDIGDALPGFGIDIEDNYRFLSNIVIEGNRFKNNYKGDIILKQCEQVRIINNFFEASTRADYFGLTNTNITNTPAISCDSARSTLIVGNQFSNKNVELGRSSRFDNNEMNNGKLNLYREYPSLNNNTFRDTQIYYGGSFALSDQRNGTVWMNNNEFYITKEWVASFVYDIGTISYNNTKFIFNQIVDLGYNTTEDITRLEAGSASMYAFRTTTVAAGTKGFGKYKGLVIQDLKPSTTYKGNSGAGINLYCNDIIDCSFSSSINIQNGLPRDIKIKNSYFNGGIKFYLDQYTSTNSDYLSNSSNKIVSVLDNTFIIDDVEDLDNSADRIFTTPVKDVNFYFKDNIIDVKVAVTGEFMTLTHYGTTIFDNTTFISRITSKVINFTGMVTDAITIIDPIVENITFTLRPIDHIVFTKASPHMATYATFADEAAATTAGYPSGYMYMTSTGEYRVKL